MDKEKPPITSVCRNGYACTSIKLYAWQTMKYSIPPLRQVPTLRPTYMIKPIHRE